LVPLHCPRIAIHHGLSPVEHFGSEGGGVLAHPLLLALLASQWHWQQLSKQWLFWAPAALFVRQLQCSVFCPLGVDGEQQVR